MPLRPGFGGKGVGLWEVISSRLNGDKKKNRRKNAKNITYIYKRVFLSYYLFIAVGALS